MSENAVLYLLYFCIPQCMSFHNFCESNAYWTMAKMSSTKLCVVVCAFFFFVFRHTLASSLTCSFACSFSLPSKVDLKLDIQKNNNKLFKRFLGGQLAPPALMSKSSMVSWFSPIRRALFSGRQCAKNWKLRWCRRKRTTKKNAADKMVFVLSFYVSRVQKKN